MRTSRIFLAVLFLSLAVRAQQPAADDLQQKFIQARQKYEAQDYKGVVALLEPHKAEPGLPPLFFAVLGGAYIELGRFQDAQ
ncbi:MAG: hypothetical protein ACLGI9_14315, partial [Thermoanaerobaculia bacterium]